MLATLVPLFDKNYVVMGYSLFVEKENKLLTPLSTGVSAFDGSFHINGLEIIDNVGLENLSGERDLFLELTQYSILSDIENECHADPKSVVFLIDPRIEPNETNLNRIDDLKKKGFRFAIKKLLMSQYATYGPILSRMDFIMFNHKKINTQNAKSVFSKAYPNLKLIAVSVDTKEEFEELSENNLCDYYEGQFFRTPVLQEGEELAPLKITYIELLKLINIPDFDLTQAADVIGHDTALVINLLEMANKVSVNSEVTSIRHAVAMIGQKELKKWINSAVTKELCVDKPNEITRTSLIRARFAENLAPLFEMAIMEQELFLMGLFSVLDIILEKPMDKALDMVVVSNRIREALVNNTGDLAKVYNFMVEYEDAHWQEVSRQIIMYNLDMDLVYKAYVDALAWFKELFS